MSQGLEWGQIGSMTRVQQIDSKSVEVRLIGIERNQALMEAGEYEESGFRTYDYRILDRLLVAHWVIFCDLE